MDGKTRFNKKNNKNSKFIKTYKDKENVESHDPQCPDGIWHVEEEEYNYLHFPCSCRVPHLRWLYNKFWPLNSSIIFSCVLTTVKFGNILLHLIIIGISMCLSHPTYLSYRTGSTWYSNVSRGLISPFTSSIIINILFLLHHWSLLFCLTWLGPCCTSLLL